MKILLINHYAGSIRHGMEYRPYYMAREWVKLGHEVHIIAASNSHVRTVAPKLDGQITHEIIDGINYMWFKTPAYSGNGVGRVKNIFSFTSQLLMQANSLANMIKPDAVIASSTYPLDNYPAHKIAKIAGAKLVYEVHDLWPLSPIEIGGMSEHHPFIMLMQWAENYAYKHCDKVISMLPLSEPHMLEHGLAPGKFHYVPNGIDTSEWNENAEYISGEHAELLQNLKMKGMFIILYAGGHAISNALNNLINAAEYLRDEKISVVLVGKGIEKERLIELAKTKKLDEVYFLPAVPKKQIPDLLSKADALYIGWQNNKIYRFGISPNKIFDYAMAGKPIIHAVNTPNDIVAEAGCGISVKPEDSRGIADAIIDMKKKSSTEREILGNHGKEYVLANHEYNILARKFIERIFTE